MQQFVVKQAKGPSNKLRLACPASGRLLPALPTWMDVQEDGSVRLRFWCEACKAYHVLEASIHQESA